MPAGIALALTAGILIAVDVWRRRGPAQAQPVTSPLAAAVLVLIGAAAGLSRDELGFGGDVGTGAGYGAACAGALALAYAVALAVPRTRRGFADERHRLPARRAVYTAAVAVPLATVIVEEVAFRGVLWGLLVRGHGPLAATVISASLFGLWHVPSALDLAREHRAIRRPVPAVLATVLFTTLAGLVLAALRHEGGNLLAPVVLHWAANGFGVLAAAWVWAYRPPDR